MRQEVSISVAQFLLATLIFKVAVVAILATMLARFRFFRRILLTERRDWPERLTFAVAFGLPLMAGVVSRLLLKFSAADISLSGPYLAGLIGGSYARATGGAPGGLPALAAGGWT